VEVELELKRKSGEAGGVGDEDGVGTTGEIACEEGREGRERIHSRVRRTRGGGGWGELPALVHAPRRLPDRHHLICTGTDCTSSERTSVLVGEGNGCGDYATWWLPLTISEWSTPRGRDLATAPDGSGMAEGVGRASRMRCRWHVKRAVQRAWDASGRRGDVGVEIAFCGGGEHRGEEHGEEEGQGGGVTCTLLQLALCRGA
jgi:hypothetical protein